MLDLAAELSAFMRAYEEANNSHDIGRVAPMIAPDATYWFTDGCYRGRPQIEAAIGRTFGTIHDENYQIRELEWVIVAPEHAVCRYRFSWSGVVGGEARSGQGRGTNVLVKNQTRWQIKHEHLST
ncbi:MAG TPA: nuclear transport factor 2 family protein [Streptosporangiaceae bacterium]|nr:nuclear transport factor 2 family protein [Streptosporangiaceae bacterium]